jgi:hypothetical protein
MKATAEPVDWAYDIWDAIRDTLTDKDNRRRAIAAQVLCSLAKSDPEHRMRESLPALLAVTKDERFVTARHCLQSLWKVGVIGAELRKQLVDGLFIRFNECSTEKNCTLIRYDILEVLAKIYAVTGDEEVRTQALRWIAAETDLKYRKKYTGLWKTK